MSCTRSLTSKSGWVISWCASCSWPRVSASFSRFRPTCTSSRSAAISPRSVSRQWAAVRIKFWLTIEPPHMYSNERILFSNSAACHGQ
uniref:Putative secreted protein n=1 Tax=Anopheles darlingi TaxID=43151 RepID=A0A2M4D4Y2_ANODA